MGHTIDDRRAETTTVRFKRRGGFTVVDNAAVRDSTLSFRARGLLAYMLSHVDGWSFSIVRLARATTEGTAAVRTAVHELEAAGYMRRTWSIDGGMKRWTYEVSDFPIVQESNDGPPNDRSSNDREPADVIEPHPIEDHRIEDHQQTLVAVAPAELVRVDPFDEFWSAYPRKTAKLNARNAWTAKVVKAKVDPELVIAAAHRYAADPNRVDKFTAHPATWLNGGRWMDEQPLPARHGHEGRGGMVKNSERLAEMARRSAATR